MSEPTRRRKPGPSYGLWIEAEVWEPGTWDPADANSNVIATFADGTRWAATFFSYANLESLTEKNRQTGENLGGKYFWASDMILVDEISRPRIEEVVAHLIREGGFASVFVQGAPLLADDDATDDTAAGWGWPPPIWIEFVIELAEQFHLEIWGSGGAPVLLLHGSTGTNGAHVWADQRSLADHYSLLVPDRRGYGQTPGPASTAWEDHVADAIRLLGSGAHFVGHSYGGVIGLLVAARRPDLVRSLTVIEPPAFCLARGNPAVDALLAQLIPIFGPDTGLTTGEFSLAFGRALGGAPRDPAALTPAQRAQTLNIMREPGPWTAPIDLAALAATPFPKLVVSGNWHPGFEAVCDVLTARLPARRLVLQGNGHSPHHVDGGHPFNAHLRDLFAWADAG